MESSTPVFDLLSNKENWTYGAFAENKYGAIVKPTNPSACRWCARGAITKVANFNKAVEYNMSCRLAEACKKLFNASIVEVNDYHGWDKICQAVKEAGI